jgi:3-isopropylmalate/(R)-2-methylmalate dehydratase small subunit
MNPLTTLECPAVVLPMAGIDTDQIIPARFMRRSRADGYGPFLLHDLRNGPDGPVPNPLDDPAVAGAQVVVARRNFGCGSSREAAVYALADFGIRCVIAPSFGDIFAANAVKNGMLPAVVSEADAEALIAAEAMRRGQPLRIDLAAQQIVAGNLVVPFTIDPVWKTQLLNGWDEIDLTLAQTPAIAAFRDRDRQARPWAVPPG